MTPEIDPKEYRPFKREQRGNATHAFAPDFTRRFYATGRRRLATDTERMEEDHALNELIERHLDGDPRALDVLTWRIRGAASALANWFYPVARRKGLERNDLSQMIMAAMIESIDNYDPELGRFFPFAYQRAKWAVMIELGKGYLIRTPAEAARQARKKQAGEDTEWIYGSDETIEAAGRVMDWEAFGPMDELGDTVETVPVDTVEDLADCDLAVDAQAVVDAIDHADMLYRERYILERRYGLHGGLPWSLEELGLELDVSRERVRQLQRAAEKKLAIYFGLLGRGDFGRFQAPPTLEPGVYFPPGWKPGMSDRIVVDKRGNMERRQFGEYR
jgi:RNA polymerase sigma factor (sigma-70 family)